MVHQTPHNVSPELPEEISLGELSVAHFLLQFGFDATIPWYEYKQTYEICISYLTYKRHCKSVKGVRSLKCSIDLYHIQCYFFQKQMIMTCLCYLDLRLSLKELNRTCLILLKWLWSVAERRWECNSWRLIWILWLFK